MSVEVAECGARDYFDASKMRQILWRTAEKSIGLEHIYVKGGPGCMDVVFFHLESSASFASADALNACNKAIRKTPELKGWRCDLRRDFWGVDDVAAGNGGHVNGKNGKTANINGILGDKAEPRM